MLAKIWNYSGWTKETDSDKLESVCDRALNDAGFTVLDTLKHYFEPQGFTKLYLLCESHFAIHTFPEEGKSYIELSSCNEKMHEKFVEAIKGVLVDD